MPDWVKDEEKWEKAKKIAKEQGEEDNYSYITGIYKKMGGRIESKENFTMDMVKNFVKKIIKNPIKAAIASILVANILKKRK